MHWAILLFRVLSAADGLIFNPIYENFHRKKVFFQKLIKIIIKFFVMDCQVKTLYVISIARCWYDRSMAMPNPRLRSVPLAMGSPRITFRLL